MKAVKITGLVYLALFAWFLVNFGLFINAPGHSSVDIDFDQAMYNFYYYGGVPLAAIACVVIFVYIGKKPAAVLSQYFLWAAMLFSFNYATKFFSNAFNLKMMTFLQGFTWLSDYLPSLVLCAILVALLSTWRIDDKKIVNAIAWVGFLFSAFMAAYVIFYIARVTDFSEAYSGLSGGFQITHAIILPVCIAWFFCITRCGELFKRVFALEDKKKGIKK